MDNLLNIKHNATSVPRRFRLVPKATTTRINKNYSFIIGIGYVTIIIAPCMTLIAIVRENSPSSYWI